VLLSPVNNFAFKSSAGILSIHSPHVTNYIELERHFKPRSRQIQQQNSSTASHVPFQKGDKVANKIDLKA